MEVSRFLIVTSLRSVYIERPRFCQSQHLQQSFTLCKWWSKYKNQSWSAGILWICLCFITVTVWNFDVDTSNTYEQGFRLQMQKLLRCCLSITCKCYIILSNSRKRPYRPSIDNIYWTKCNAGYVATCFHLPRLNFRRTTSMRVWLCPTSIIPVTIFLWYYFSEGEMSPGTCEFN